MNMAAIFTSPINILLFVLGVFVFILVVSLLLSKIIPIFIDEKYRKDSKIWFFRNWKWFLPAVIIIAVGLSLSSNQIMKSSQIYKQSVELLKQSEKAKNLLGVPITLGFFVKGEVSFGAGHIYYSVSGLKENATLVADAGAKNGELKMNSVVLVLDSGKQVQLTECN